MVNALPPGRLGLGSRRGWLGLVAGVIAVGVLETAVLHFIGWALLPVAFSSALDVVVVLLTAVLLLAFASPLWSGHRVEDDRLRLRFGWLAACDVPTRLIESIEPYRPTPLRGPGTEQSLPCHIDQPAARQAIDLRHTAVTSINAHS